VTFKQLKEKWYKKLEKAGFIDEEVKHPYLIPPPSYRWAMKEQIEEFYRLATWYATAGKFTTQKEQKVWERFCEGDTITEIANKFNMTTRRVVLCIQGHKQLMKEAIRNARREDRN